MESSRYNQMVTINSVTCQWIIITCQGILLYNNALFQIQPKVKFLSPCSLSGNKKILFGYCMITLGPTDDILCTIWIGVWELH